MSDTLGRFKHHEDTAAFARRVSRALEVRARSLLKSIADEYEKEGLRSRERDEALAAKERLTETLGEHLPTFERRAFRELVEEFKQARDKAEAENARLNAALAGAREKCIKVIRALPEMSVGQHPEDMRTHCIGAIWKALSTPSSEKAEGTEEDGR